MGEVKYVWTFEFVPIDDRVPGNVRARKLLKASLRSFGMKCIRMDRRPDLDEPKPPPKPTRAQRQRTVKKPRVIRGRS